VIAVSVSVSVVVVLIALGGVLVWQIKKGTLLLFILSSASGEWHSILGWDSS
jgi:hypothetical protein